MELMDLLMLLILFLATPAPAVLGEFSFVNLTKNWTAAQNYCREKFADLATIENAEDWARVREIVGNSGQTDAWIGLYDDVNSWRWSVDNTSLNKDESKSWLPFHAYNWADSYCGYVYFQLYPYNTKCSTSQMSLCYDATSNSYIPVTDRKPWKDAQSYCRQTYTDLASIRNEQEFVSLMSVTSPNGQYWIGLSRESWKWSDQSQSSFRNWGPNEPRTGKKRCAGARVQGLFGVSCEKQLPFICSERPTPALTVPREFYFVNSTKTWTEAQSYCRENFDDLVTIEGKDDWLRVKEMVQNTSHPDLWIGLYDDENSWRWSLDNTSLDEQKSESWFRFNPSHYDYYCGYASAKKYLRNYPCHTKRKSVCYDETSNSYIPVEDVNTWQGAESYCRQTYTDLASIRNKQELNSLMSAVSHSGAQWVGLSRERWKWSDQSYSSFRGWRPREPQRSKGNCAGAAVDGLFANHCHELRPFICSAAPQRKVLKATLKTDGSVNLNDPLVQAAVLKQMEIDLRGKGVHQELSLKWRKQEHGDVFNKTEL